MPLDPSIFNQIQAPDYAGAFGRGMQLGETIQDRPNRLADLAAQRELRSQQVTQGRQEIEAYPQQQAAAAEKDLFDRQIKIGGVLTKLQESIAMGNVSDDAIKQQAMQAKQYGIPDNIIQQTFGAYLQTPAEQRASIAKSHVTDYNKWYEANSPSKPTTEAQRGQIIFDKQGNAYNVNPYTNEVRPVAVSGSQIQGAQYSPELQGQISGARSAASTVGKGQGESTVELQDIQSQMPNLEKLVTDLSAIGKKATYTKAGQAADITKRQLGMEVGEGAIARKEYISKVDNEILPLLRQTFGAAFTAKEGESLRATLGDPDASPKEKDAVLRSFIDTKKAQVESLKRRIGQPSTGGFEADKEARYQAWKAKQGR